MDRPTAWLAGVGVGLLLVSGVGLVALAGGLALPWWAYCAWFGLGLGGTVAWEYGAGAVVYWRDEKANLEQKRQNNSALAVQTAVRAWELKSAQRAAAVASGREGAREAEALERAWQLGLEILFRAIDKAGGASGRKLAGVVGSDTHPALMAFYCSPAGLCILRDAGGNVGHTWGYKADGQEWALDDVLPLIRAGKLPHPDGAVPEINPLPDSAAQRKAPRQSATQKKAEIIEGTAREAGQ